MSWSIKSIGPRAAVRLAVLAVLTMPPALQASIVAVLDEPGNGNGCTIPASPHDFARVEGYGHSGGGYGSIGKLEVELFTAAKLSDHPLTCRTTSLRGELDEVRARVNEIDRFIDGPVFGALDEQERELIKGERHARNKLRTILQMQVNLIDGVTAGPGTTEAGAVGDALPCDGLRPVEDAQAIAAAATDTPTAGG